MIVGIMRLASGFEPSVGHMVGFYLAIVVLVGAIGSTKQGSSARYWICGGIYTFAAWIILVISLLATGVSRRDFKHEPAISTSFYNSTGWTSHGYVYILGWQYCTIASGSDASAHMSEETQNPARNVPKAMTWSIVATYVLAYISIIIMFLSVSPHISAKIVQQEFPVGHILEAAVNKHFAVGMSCIFIICFCLQLQAQLQASSRFVFALARDRALPFSDTIKRTNASKQPWVAHAICVALWAACAPTLVAASGVVFSVVTVTAGTLSMLGYVSPPHLPMLGPSDPSSSPSSSTSSRKRTSSSKAAPRGRCASGPGPWQSLARCTASPLSWRRPSPAAGP